MLRRILKISLIVIGCLALIFAGLVIYVRAVSRAMPPVISETEGEVSIIEADPGLFVSGKNWFRRSESGLYELYVEGTPYQRGLVAGLLTKELVQYQEKVFNDQIEMMIPSRAYREVLKYLVGWFNRDLALHVPEEYQLEIFGLSHAASHEYDHIAEPYQRILNYHAAHDIGHALQNMSLVGCTSFATWGNDSEDSLLTIGRNFDFYAGDDFARNKIVAFYNPGKGHKFMMVTFGGMIGVLSGMNEAGLTVTINAAKSEIPAAAATPVSIVSREILQYASTIQEAYEIVKKREMFVAESFLIGSVKDGRAAIIEKSNTSAAIYDPGGSHIVCTNHFQSDSLGNTEINRDHIRNSASAYRYKRVEELLSRNGKNDVKKSISILRDQRGINDVNIGLGNEKLINQLVAHHGIVFQPEKQLVWISTAPWQLGKFVCYDLNKVFDLDMDSNKEIYEPGLEVQADSFLLTKAYRNFLKISKYRFPFSSREGLDPDSLVLWNPESYHAHMMAGDHYFGLRQYKKALEAYEEALSKEVATVAEKEYIMEHIQACKDELK